MSHADRLAEIDNELAAALRRNREATDQLCERCGIPFSLVVKYVAGQRTPAPWLARKIADAAGLELAEAFPRVAQRSKAADRVNNFQSFSRTSTGDPRGSVLASLVTPPTSSTRAPTLFPANYETGAGI